MSWTVLPLDAAEAPRLLVKSRFDKDGYSVQLTDLSRVWSDTLTKAEIIQRASDVGSSIDPGEDDEQFNILIRKIESALKSEKGTSLRLSSRDGPTTLRLELSAPLPQPLPPFKWTVQLKLQPEEQVQSELLTPLILHASSLQQKIQQLVDQLHDKDRVISKICDRLETSGNDLTTVFPGASNVKTSRKKSQREQLAKHVKGLSDFDETLWRAQDHRVQDGDMNAETVNHVFAGLPSAAQLPGSKHSAEWWEHLSDDVVRGSLPASTDEHPNMKTGSSEQERPSNGSVDPEEAIQIDEFQRQETPPHQTRHRMVQSQKNDESDGSNPPPTASRIQMDGDSTTDDEDDLDAPPRKPLSSHKGKSPEIASPAPARKLGMIGGRPPQQQSSSTGEFPSASKDPVPDKPRPRLGALGGKSKHSENTHDRDDELVEGVVSLSTAPRSRLGAISTLR